LFEKKETTFTIIDVGKIAKNNNIM